MSADNSTPPLAPRDFLILMALVSGRVHGYGILQSIKEESGGSIHMDPANLYRSLRRLAREGLVQEHSPDDQRRRHYELTVEGRATAEVEADRLARLVDLAKHKRLIPASRQDR